MYGVIADILESSMHTLQEGQALLDRIREMGMHADVQNRHATTAACYGIEQLLELLQVGVHIVLLHSIRLDERFLSHNLC